MSNILILSGSPRINGNSNILCDEFSKGAIEAGHKVEKINVSRKQISGCIGCNKCMENGGNCIQKDDMEEIKEKMLLSDIIVLASPIYYYSICAQLKLVIDRTYAFFNKLNNKRFYYIISCAADEEKYTETMIKALDGFTCCLKNSKIEGIIKGINSMDIGDVRKSDVIKKAYEMGKNVK